MGELQSERMRDLMAILFLALPVSSLVVREDACRLDYSNQASCESDVRCTWCKAAAVPSSCFEKTYAKEVPPEDFDCAIASRNAFNFSASPYTFLSIGDWGGAAIGTTKSYSAKKNVYAVAQAMAKTAVSINPKFIINTGDNFYWCGIQNTSDFQIATDWLNPYNDPSLNLPWYNVLGNHEYGYNVDAQVEMAAKYDNWILDNRYYTKRLQITESVHISFVFLDTSPCVQEYRSSSKSGWDPCGSEYPTCSLTNDPNDDFEGQCKFHDNIVSQDCSEQYDWFKRVLSTIPSDDWLIVVGHHPIDETDVEDFTEVLQANGFDLYLNGHAHTLTQYTVDGSGAYATTGAGSLVNTADQLGETPARRRNAARVRGEEQIESSRGHTYKTVWNRKVAGFTAHSFNSDYTQLTTDFIDYDGNVVHSFHVSKGSGPSPKPIPSTGGCCYFHEAACNGGAVCCRSHCRDPASCSYSEAGCNGRYGSKHLCQWDGTTCKVHSVALPKEL